MKLYYLNVLKLIFVFTYLVVISQYFQRTAAFENSQPPRSPFQGDGRRLAARRLRGRSGTLNELWCQFREAPARVLQKDFRKYYGTDTLYGRVCRCQDRLQKGGVPATPSGTATLLRLSPSYHFRPRPLLSVTDFRRPRLPWLDGRCVQGPGTYSPRHG